MDCSVDPPQVTGVLALHERWVRDICVIEGGDDCKTQLLVGVYGRVPPYKIHIVNLQSGRIERSTEEMSAKMKDKFNPTGVTADNHGIFVCDLGNRCIQIFFGKGWNIFRAPVKERGTRAGVAKVDQME